MTFRLGVLVVVTATAAPLCLGVLVVVTATAAPLCLGVLVVVTATAAPGAGTHRETGPASAPRSGGQARPARARGQTGTDVNPLEIWVL
jgi:hypothetical protein